MTSQAKRSGSPLEGGRTKVLIVEEVDGQNLPPPVAHPRETAKVSIFSLLYSHSVSNMSGMKGETPNALEEGPQDANPLWGTPVEGTVFFGEKNFSMSNGALPSFGHSGNWHNFRKISKSGGRQ
jgi:hypothetical protein